MCLRFQERGNVEKFNVRGDPGGSGKNKSSRKEVISSTAELKRRTPQNISLQNLIRLRIRAHAVVGSHIQSKLPGNDTLFLSLCFLIRYDSVFSYFTPNFN